MLSGYKVECLIGHVEELPEGHPFVETCRAHTAPFMGTVNIPCGMCAECRRAAGKAPVRDETMGALLCDAAM